MQAEKQLEAPVNMVFYKKVRPFIYLTVVIGTIIAFKEFILQLLLIIFLIGCIGFVMYKGVTYLFKFGYLLFRVVLSIMAFFVALGGFLWVMNLFN